MQGRVRDPNLSKLVLPGPPGRDVKLCLAQGCLIPGVNVRRNQGQSIFLAKVSDACLLSLGQRDAVFSAQKSPNDLVELRSLAIKEFTVALGGKTRTQPTEHQSSRPTILTEDSKGSGIQ